MNILLIAFGTRGDVQPVIAFGKGLHEAGHDVRVMAGANFCDWIRSHGLGIAETQIDVQAMMQSERGVAWAQARSPWDELRNMRELYAETGLQMARDMQRAAPWADLIVGGFTSDNFAHVIAQKLGKRYITHALQPLHPTRLGEATNQPVRAQGESVFNKGSTAFAERMLFQVYDRPMNAFRRELGEAPQTRRHYYDTLHAVPALCAFSVHVVPQPRDWPAHKHITGYWFLDEGSAWLAPPELQSFLQAGPAPIYVGFGSMSDRDGAATGEMIIRTLRANKLRVVLSHGWAGLSTAHTDADVFVIDGVPHDGLFPRMAAIIHHGGAGTTAAAFRAGVPQLVVPHFGDQNYWGRRVYELGVGPKPVPRRRLTAVNLSEATQVLAQNAAFRSNARHLGDQIRRENGVTKAVTLVQEIYA